MDLFAVALFLFMFTPIPTYYTAQNKSCAERCKWAQK